MSEYNEPLYGFGRDEDDIDYSNQYEECEEYEQYEEDGQGNLIYVCEEL